MLASANVVTDVVQSYSNQYGPLAFGTVTLLVILIVLTAIMKFVGIPLVNSILEVVRKIAEIMLTLEDTTSGANNLVLRLKDLITRLETFIDRLERERKDIPNGSDSRKDRLSAGGVHDPDL